MKIPYHFYFIQANNTLVCVADTTSQLLTHGRLPALFRVLNQLANGAPIVIQIVDRPYLVYTTIISPQLKQAVRQAGSSFIWHGSGWI